jgi:hypothetical protein
MLKPFPYSKAQKTFRTLFIFSTSLSLLLILLALGKFYFSSQTPPEAEPPAAPGLIEEVVTRGSVITMIASVTTSLISLIGFVSTLILGWRKEARDTKTSELERKKLEFELEKQRIELSKLKAEEERKLKSEP